MKTCTKCGAERDSGRKSWCKKCTKEYNSKYYQKNSAAIRAQVSEYYSENSDAVKAYQRRYESANREKVNARASARDKIRRVEDPLWALKQKLRSRIWNALRSKRYSKRLRTMDMFGADLETISNHLEATFLLNYGTERNGQTVEIDHIIPCASAKNEDELIALQHYTNLQYLKPEDNRRKSSKTGWNYEQEAT